MKAINSITLEIISNNLLSIAEQMGVILSKTGYSTNIKERKDLSVALFNPEGKLLTLAQHIPLHFSSLSGSVEVLTKTHDLKDIHDGDVFIANDPYSGGGSHLPDIVLLKPVFYHGELVAFAVNTGHHADRRGHGSTIYDEGLRIPVVKLYDRGNVVPDIMNLIMTNFQMKYERQGDLRAQMTTNQFGADKLCELIDKIGLDTYREFCQKWIEYGEKKARHAISLLPDSDYSFEDYLDDDGVGNQDLLIKVRVHIQGDRILFDFTGTCAQTEGPCNCVPNALKATIYYSMMSLLDHTIPANSGFFDCVEIQAEPGSIVWATEPAPTFDRENTAQRVADVIFGAFSHLDPTKVTAAGNGCISYFNLAGYDTRNHRPYVYVETIGGGSGARYNKDGLDAVHVHMTNTSNLPVEALEMEYPLMVEQYALYEDSCGPGKFRGGMGIVRSIRILPESQNSRLVSASTERCKRHPWGLEGGGGGGLSSITITRQGKVLYDAPKMQGIRLQDGDVIEMRTPGGGGYGPVTQRPTEWIERDYREGRISDSWLKNAGITLPALTRHDPK